MSWDAVASFIKAEDPSFAASLQGVPPDDLARVEHAYGVRLPNAYRQFVLLMGEESAGFYLFGPGQNQRFRDVVAQLPEESYPAHDYFKIAYAADESMISPPDHYLDLTRTDVDDAPIVMFEGGGGFRPEHVRDKGFTFLEQVTRRIFAFFAGARTGEKALVVVPNLTPGRAKLSTSSVVTLLEMMNLDLVLPSFPRVSCHRRGNLWAVTDMHAGGLGIAVSLWSDERRPLNVVVDQLLLRFPEATVKGPGGPLAS